MNVVLAIPEELGRALANSPDALRQRVALDLALHYYAEGHLSLGKAAELAELGTVQFERALAERKMIRNYSEEDLDADLAWARKTP